MQTPLHISNFDPLIRNRLRLRRMFNFDYRIEVFVPDSALERLRQFIGANTVAFANGYLKA